MKKVICLVLLLCLTAVHGAGLTDWRMKPPLGVTINWDHPLAKGLVGCWLFNERTGNIVFDSSSNQNKGTFVNQTFWRPDGINADGVNDSVNIPWTPLKSVLFKGSTIYPFAIVTAGKHHTLNSGSGTITISANATQSESFFVGVQNTNDAMAASYDAAVFKAALSAKKLVADERYHIVGQFFSTTLREVWLNGVGPDQNTEACSPNLAALDRVNFFYLDRLTDAWYQAKDVEYVYVYNRALSASEVQQLYADPFGMFRPAFDLKMYWGIPVSGGAPPQIF